MPLLCHEKLSATDHSRNRPFPCETINGQMCGTVNAFDARELQSQEQCARVCEVEIFPSKKAGAHLSTVSGLFGDSKLELFIPLSAAISEDCATVSLLCKSAKHALITLSFQHRSGRAASAAQCRSLGVRRLAGPRSREKRRGDPRARRSCQKRPPRRESCQSSRHQPHERSRSLATTSAKHHAVPPPSPSPSPIPQILHIHNLIAISEVHFRMLHSGAP